MPVDPRPLGDVPTPAVPRDQPGQSPHGPAFVPSQKPKMDLPLEQPHPVLKAAGVSGGIKGFNQRVAQIAEAHQNAYGLLPSPGLTLDILKSGVDPQHYGALFSVPRDPIVAKAQGALYKASRGEVAPDSVDVLAKKLSYAIKSGNLPQFIHENSDAVNNVWDDQHSREALTTALYRSGVNDPAQTVAASLFPVKPNLLGKIIEAPAKPTEQITLGIGEGIPTLGFQEGRAVVKSVQQRSAAPFLHTNKALAEATYEGVKRDITHPQQNIGNLILDAWGAVSLGGGLVARSGAVGRAVAEGAGARAVVRAALTKTPTGTHELGQDANVPLSTNHVAAKVQSFILDRRMKGLTNGDSQPVPSGALAVTLTERAKNLASDLTDPFGLRTRYGSIENKIQRELRAGDRVEQAMRLAVVDPALMVSRSAVSTDGVISRIGPRRWLGLSPAEQKAIQVAATDSLDPVTDWRDFHERAIQNGWGDPAAHEAHLSLLGPAEKALSKPSSKLAHAIDATRDLMGEQTILRIQQLGLSPEAAEGHIADVGKLVRGEVSNPTKNVRVPAFTGSDEILRLAAMGKKPEEIATELTKPFPEGASDTSRPRYASHDDALKAVRAKLSSPEAKKALTPERVRSARVNPESFYSQFVSPAHTRRPGGFWGVRSNKFGIPVPSSMPELNHVFTGDSIKAGNFRVDATNLARESYTRTVHAVTRLNAWKRLWDHYSDETPLTDFHQPIRDEKAVDAHLKGLLSKIDQGQLGSKDAEGLTEEAIQNLNRFLFPSKDEVQPGEHVRWVDQRLLDDTRSIKPGVAAKAFQVVNEPLRDLLIYVRPAYAIQFINNAIMAGIEQGVFSGPNFVRALRANDWYGNKVTRMLDAMAGEGRMQSYAPEAGAATKLSHALGGVWSRATDVLWRRAAVIHELRKLGYRTTDEIKSAVLNSLEDKNVMTGMKEASRRAKESMVPFDNLTWAEKAYLRHFIFVYPWQSRSLVWSLKFLRDHPAQAAIYNEIGQSQIVEQDPVMKHLPAWMKDSSVFPVGWHGDNPIVVNPASVDTWGTMGEVVGLAHGDSTISDLFGPGADIALHEATGRDRFGRQYKNRWTGPILDTLTGLPQVAAYNRANKVDTPVPANDVSNLRGLINQERVESKNSLYLPEGFMNTYGPLLFGGLAPRVLDAKAVEAKFWKTAPYPDRIKHETSLMLRESKLQGDLVSRAVPQDVKDGIRLVGARSLAYHDFTAKQGRTPTLKEKTQLDIQLLQHQHLISDGQASELSKRLDAAPADQIENFRSGLLGKLAYGDAMSEWHQKVLTVARVANPQKLDEDVQRLIKSKLLEPRYSDAAKADEKTLTEYGRGFLGYTEKVKQFTKQAAELSKKGLDTSEVAAELRAYVDEHSTPVKVNGQALPPYPSLALSRLTQKQLDSAKVEIYSTPWLQLSATDKLLAGKTTDPRVSRALVAYAHYTSKEYLDKALPIGDRSLAPSQRLGIIKQLDSSYGLSGKLLAQYKFANMPRFKQYAQLAIFKQSKHQDDWREILTDASQLWNAAHPGGNSTAAITDAQMHDAWTQWNKSALPIIEKKSPGFYAEIKPYLDHNPHFLEELLTQSHA